MDPDIKTRIYDIKQVIKGYINNPDPKSINTGLSLK